jgi:hypothetical protein
MTPNGFDRLARPYRWMEFLSFGPMLQRCRTHFLPQMYSVRNALVLGDGDGRFTAQLLQAVPQAHVTAIDASGAMLAQLRHNCRTNADRLTTHQAAIPSALPPLIAGQTYDLVATHFFLDCLTTPEVGQLAAILRPHLADNALWIISDFAIASGPLRLPTSAIVGSLYKAFRALTGLQTQRLPEHEAALHANGFARIERKVLLGGLLATERWQPHIEL